MIQDNDLKKFLETIGKNLRAVRIARRMEIEMVAEAMNLTSDTLRMVEAGQFEWEVELIARLCNYYKITPALIINEKRVNNTIVLVP